MKSNTLAIAVASLLVGGVATAAYMNTRNQAPDATGAADATEADRLAALDDWQHKLERCLAGEADHPVFIALAVTVKAPLGGLLPGATCAAMVSVWPHSTALGDAEAAVMTGSLVAGA